MGGKQVEGVRGQSGTNWHKHGHVGGVYGQVANFKGVRGEGSLDVVL